ncbi:hypothetical protein MLD38_015011 [Melastoma candidum]|uniref:Uncharacterized protein n=1 Tax=Melastoma candidum TaxID=119954 RepID=A0ACB9RIV8_9MYRT|nr:hypothetical protein MLD38_015011 [Melastoma candidum]
MGRRVSLRNIISGCFTPHSSSPSCSCFWATSGAAECAADPETKPLVLGDNTTRAAVRLKDFISGNQTLGFHLKPKTVTLKVAMHCDGCAKRVKKHIAKMDGVTSYKVDLENKMVIVVGDVIPVEVAESLSRVKLAELWYDDEDDDSGTPSSETMEDEDDQARLG